VVTPQTGGAVRHRRRHLDWPDCFNIRDLGGLPTTDGRTTRLRAVVRADDVNRLSAAGWAALWEYGVRTVIDLRNGFEVGADLAMRPAGLHTMQVPLDDNDDVEFWDHVRSHRLDGSPLYYPHFLEEKAEQCAAVVTAIARAEPGGVLFHCAAGRDRTGLVALVLLSLAGVEPDHIAADYEQSTARLERAWSILGMADQGAEIRAHLDSLQTTPRTLILDLLQTFDAKTYLQAAGVSETDLTALTTRLLAKSPT
jgi:protein-tyrosine phosphatase